VQRTTRVAVVSHGCKLNQFEGESLEYALAREGFRIVGADDDPDCVVVNTCTVTRQGDRKSRNTIMRAARAMQKEGLLVVTGCYAQTDPDELRKLGGVGLVVSQRDKSTIPGLLAKHFKGTSLENDFEAGPFGFLQPLNSPRSRAFVKVQDGCDRRCGYCKVPLARGRSVSRDYRDIARTLHDLYESGYREVVLTGINLGSYGYESLRLSGLLTYLLGETSSSLRLRLSSIEPDCFDDSLFEVMTDKRIMPHVHIPLQSGSDRVLRRMSRPYGVAQYRRIIDRIRALREECHLATDLIVGFPGEEENDFMKTVDLVREANYASVHVFRYSRREGTAAALMDDDVSPGVKTERSACLVTLGRTLHYQFCKQFGGSVREAVLEPHKRGYIGITDNYIRVHISGGNPGLARSCLPVQIDRVTEERTEGRIVERSS
jgi:threonylcarbamoyladenosine tRNA methylthiotransferase MtaB